MTDGLRAALEAAYQKRKEAFHRDEVLSEREVIDLFESHVLAWLKEKAGEEPIGAIQSALLEWASGDRSGNLADHLERHLSPLFVALRVRAEEAEALAEKRAEDTDRIRRERDRWRENCMATARGLREADTQIESLRKRAEDAEAGGARKAEIARKALQTPMVRSDDDPLDVVLDALREIGGAE